jgi:UPF0755 protein
MYKKLFYLCLIFVLSYAIFLSYKAFKYEKQAKQEQIAKNKKAEEISITILEGWSNKNIADYLEKQGVVTSTEFLKTISNFDISNFKFLPKKIQGNLQGFLYPDTYRFFKVVTDRSKTTAKEASETIIKKMLTNFETKLPINADALAKKQNLSLYEAIILASIVEKEANNFPNEKATIAGIFLNRLNIGMPLQSDATVNYATGKSEASPSLDDLEVNSPYNTYKHKGLPPAPICNPSIASIKAVLEPIETNYIYYLHNQKTGQPYYAKTYEEHLINKQKYLR